MAAAAAAGAGAAFLRNASTRASLTPIVSLSAWSKSRADSERDGVVAVTVGDAMDATSEDVEGSPGERGAASSAARDAEEEEEDVDEADVARRSPKLAFSRSMDERVGMYLSEALSELVRR